MDSKTTQKKKPVTCTKSELARHFGRHPSTVTRWKREGKLKGCFLPNGRIKMNEAIEAIQKNLNQSERYKKSGEATRRRFGKSDDAQTVDLEKITQAGIDPNISMTESQRLQGIYRAALLKLEFEGKQKELLPASEVLEKWTDHIKRAKVRILSIKSKCAPLLMDFVDDLEDRESILQLIDSTCREALEELAEDK